LVTAAGSQGHPSSTHQSVAFWIPNAAANSILGYTVTADGNVPPSRTIAGDLTGLDAPSAVTTDADGTLYVANAGNNSVTIYAPDADGNAPPLRTLRGPSTGLAGPQGIAVDAAQAIYVANTSRGRVTVYPPGARGDVWPVRSIWGSRTGLGLVHGIAVDRHGAVYVASQYLGRISVFSANADGNVRPARVIKGLWDHPAGDPAYQHWEGLTEPWGLALGTDERIYATMIENAVMVFKRGAQGFPNARSTDHAPDSTTRQR
jgi:DNA-binding beta-propeller fold protein YncE